MAYLRTSGQGIELHWGATAGRGATVDRYQPPTPRGTLEPGAVKSRASAAFVDPALGFQAPYEGHGRWNITETAEESLA